MYIVFMRFGGVRDINFVADYYPYGESVPNVFSHDAFCNCTRQESPPPRKWQGGASSFSFSRKMGGHSKAETKDGWLPKEEEEWGRDKVGGQRRRVWAPKKREDDVLPKRIHITCVIQEATLNFCPQESFHAIFQHIDMKFQKKMYCLNIELHRSRSQYLGTLSQCNRRLQRCNE